MRIKQHIGDYWWALCLGGALVTAHPAQADTIHGLQLARFDGAASGASPVGGGPCLAGVRCLADVLGAPAIAGSPAPVHAYRSSLDLGTYGPLRFKFTGNRVKMKWQF